MEQEKIFASHLSDKRLPSKIYEELIQVSSPKNNQLQHFWNLGKAVFCYLKVQCDFKNTYCKPWIKSQNEKKTNRNIANKMLNITNYQRNANQNYNEVSPHTGQNGHHQKVYKQ